MMLEERHHPTDDIVKNRVAAGKPAPDKKFTCHHVVEGKGKRITNPLTGEEVQNDRVIDSRLVIHSVGIGINDAGNGVWLPKSMDNVPHRAMPKALPHANIHTKVYEEHVYDILANTNRKAANIRSKLNFIAKELQAGQVEYILTDKSSKKFGIALNRRKSKRFA